MNKQGVLPSPLIPPDYTTANYLWLLIHGLKLDALPRSHISLTQPQAADGLHSFHGGQSDGSLHLHFHCSLPLRFNGMAEF
jgi:hypothetical protein